MVGMLLRGEGGIKVVCECVFLKVSSPVAIWRLSFLPPLSPLCHMQPPPPTQQSLAPGRDGNYRRSRWCCRGPACRRRWRATGTPWMTCCDRYWRGGSLNDQVWSSRSECTLEKKKTYFYELATENIKQIFGERACVTPIYHVRNIGIYSNI